MIPMNGMLSDLADYIRSQKEKLERLEKANDLSTLLVAFFDLKNDYEELDALRKELYQLVDRYNKYIIPREMERRDIDKMQVASIARSFYPVQKTSTSVADKDKAFEWLRVNGGEALIQETINSSSLSAFVTTMMKETGKEPPQDVIKTHTYNITGISKYKPKEK